MKFSVPVNAAGEVEALVEAGADELYCGLLDEWWRARYGDHDSASRRQGLANFTSFSELESATGKAREAGVPVQLALNARYTEPQLDHLVGLAQRFEACGGAGVIASDLGLIWRLAHETSLPITLSILAVAQNASALRAFRQLGASRVILPRFIGPDEAGSLLAAVPGIEGGVMAFFDKCPLVDGYCRHRHGVGYPDRTPMPDEADEADPLFTFDTTYRTHACLGTSCDYLEPYPCAACFLQRFEVQGVAMAKLGGRGRPLEERLRALRFLLDAQELADDAARQRLYRQTFGQECACYYGADTQRRDAIEPILHPHRPSKLNARTASSVGSSDAPSSRPFAGGEASIAACAEALDHLREGDTGEHLREISAECSSIAPASRSHVGSETSIASFAGALDHLREGDAGKHPRGISSKRSSIAPASRSYVGSETSIAAFADALDHLREGDVGEHPQDLVLLVPPLGDRDLQDFLARLPRLQAQLPAGSRIVANDLGTLVALCSALSSGEAVAGKAEFISEGEGNSRAIGSSHAEDNLAKGPAPITLTMGSLLARLDDAEEVERFLMPEKNPPRPIYDLDGRPRMLVYAPPPAPLVAHWRTPSHTEPSAAQAIALLVGRPVAYEFT